MRRIVNRNLIMTICIDNKNYFELIVKRKHIKYAYIKVKANRLIEINAPKKMPYEIIAEMVKAKSKWILSMSEEIDDDFSCNKINIPPITLERKIEEKYKAEEASYDSFERIYSIVKVMKASIPEIRVRHMSTQWGSCIRDKNRVWLNAYLIGLPKSCMDLVLLREIMKLRGMTWEECGRQLDVYMPYWREVDAILNNVMLPTRNDVKRAIHI